MASKNEIQPIFGSTKVQITDPTALAAKARESASSGLRGGAPEGSDFMNFSGKKGRWTIGADKRVVDSDERWLVNVLSFQDGWVCWKGGNVVYKNFVSIYSDVPLQTPDMDQYGPYGDGEGFFAAKALVMRSVDEDQQGYFAINSKSGVDAVATLLEDISDRMSSGNPYWPLVTLSSEEFTSQGYKNEKPVFVVEAWLSDEHMKMLQEDGDWETIIDAAIGEAEAGEVPQVEDTKESAKEKTQRKRRSRLTA